VCDQNPAIRLVSIASNESASAPGSGSTSPDVQGAAFGTDDRQFQLRAERSGQGSGRIYTITYEATDASGNATSGTVTVTVPRSQGNP
jgi:endo-1,4-beta-xylanase